ncbi:hypothetical protein CRU87_05130 [Aliarcobacter trophiarum LMG 25534]|uniref:Membrane protein n=1 Tax=Aliarcobacter trophiarum LMG 25534 TaxID=1032241 RepID=A0AAD0VML6_9BACT|nr:hypothetical protein [Aliarcobacter trophiarum]AXK49369.1 putative membrane protein [Aliarcobacter trophiarum LMG 25534]RXI27823.1 hypothetical protein CRU89_03225 [Aliarcobacter trophiarum]RXJ92013.1 hypothetical protein CRU87_05130 [Aliarcobacter trophiarum LMG 25534]
MGLKSYIVSTILLTIILFGFVHSLELGDYTLSLFGFEETFSVSVWFILPVVFLTLLTYIHIMFYGVVNYFKFRLIDSDLDNMIDLIKAKLLNKEHKVAFRTKKQKELANILEQLNIDVKKESFSSSFEDLNKTVAAVQNVNNGLYVEKNLKVDEKSLLGKQNLINKINSQVDFAVDIVKKAEKYDSDIVDIAFVKALEEKSMTTIKKIYKNINLNKELTIKLLEKNAQNSEFGLDIVEITELIKNKNFTKDDYLELAKTYKSSFNPDELIELFEKISNEYEEATPAYLYILVEFEMKDKIREYLSNTQDSDYSAFKALVDLRDAGKHYSLESLSYK